MIVVLSAIAWLLGLSLVFALSLAARRGDELARRESLAREAQTGESLPPHSREGGDRASQNRHA